jgi:capsular exopolysaccharide synthesis family protein
MKTHTGQKGNSGVTHERSFQEYMAIIARGKWIILAVFVAVLVATILYTKLSAPVYQAACQVLLNSNEQKSTIFLDAARTEGMKNITQNELAILNSRVLADSVADRLRRQQYLDPAHTELIPILQPLPEQPATETIAPIEVVSGRLVTAVDFDPVRDSDIIKISSKSKNAREAALLANTYAEAYRDRNIYMSRTRSRSFREFLESQARDKRKSLEETEASLQNYMENQGIVSLDDESKRLIDQLSQLEAKRDETEISLRQLQNTLASYQEQLPQQETNVARVVGEASDTYIRQMQEQLARLEVQRDVTVVQNPSSVGREMLNEKVKEIDQQIAALRLKLQKRTDDFLRTLTPAQGSAADAAGYLKSVKQKIIETEIDVQALQSKKAALNDAIRDYEVKFDRIPGKSVQLARLQRSRLSNEKLYLMVEEKFNEANITEQSNIGYVEIIEAASIPRLPSSPRPLINLAIGLVLGLTLGIIAVIVKEYLDVRLQTPEDLKRHGFNPLATITNMDAEIGRLGGAKLTAKDKAVDSHLITLAFPFSSIAESYRQMRTNLQFARVGHPVRTVLFTSPAPSEGKSTTACNLGVAFAQTGKKVLLVDADLRRPTLDQKFNVKRIPGLSEVLTQGARFQEVVQTTRVENLHVLASGDIPPNPAEALGSDQMRDFVEMVTRIYDVVLFDSSPVLAVTDPAVVSTMVDGTVFVVSAAKTRVQELEQAAEVIEGVGGKAIGVVMNNFDPVKAYGISYRKGGRHRYSYSRVYYGGGKDGEGAAGDSGQAKSGQAKATQSKPTKA